MPEGLTQGQICIVYPAGSAINIGDLTELSTATFGRGLKAARFALNQDIPIPQHPFPEYKLNLRAGKVSFSIPGGAIPPQHCLHRGYGPECAEWEGSVLSCVPPCVFENKTATQRSGHLVISLVLRQCS